ncbi:hypothetical protein PIB30_054796 [Stylosanthes scabra]|uniref:Uncharacterized protein n=1 Tax=Stylosanthes scabra TaxID=79078 RepID=A0ABU6TKH8_9FABA|nr:hypothetical protein [Stylosanthes scabra]
MVGNPRTVERHDGAAHAVVGGATGLDQIEPGEDEIEGGLRWAEQGEVGLGFGLAEGAGSGVVGPGCGLSSVEGAKPDAGLLPWVSDLGGEAALWPLSDAAKAGLGCGLKVQDELGAITAAKAARS